MVVESRGQLWSQMVPDITFAEGNDLNSSSEEEDSSNELGIDDDIPLFAPEHEISLSGRDTSKLPDPVTY